MKIKPRLITFDFGDTLVSSDPPYLTRIWMGLKELGVSCKLEEVEKSYHMADWLVSEELFKTGEFGPGFYQKRLGENLLSQLGVKDKQAQMLEELYRWLVGVRPERVMIPGVAELLVELKKRGYKMGIISNNDGKTREKCRAVGIEGYFEMILDSTLEGLVKPDPRFFARALKQAGVEPEEALHVGDLWGSDVMGARASGVWAVWIENKYLKPGSREKVFKVKRSDQALEFLK